MRNTGFRRRPQCQKGAVLGKKRGESIAGRRDRLCKPDVLKAGERGFVAIVYCEGRGAQYRGRLDRAL